MQRVVVCFLITCCLILYGTAEALAAGENVEQLARDLGSIKPDVRWKAADTLADLGPEGAAAVPALIKALGSIDSQLRWRAGRAVGAIGPKAAAAAEALVSSLSDRDPLVREYAVDALGRIGVTDDRVLNALAKAITDKDHHVRAEAVGALTSLDLDPQKRIALVVNVLNDAEPSVVAPALNAIAEYAEEGSPALIKALRDPKSRYWGCLIAAEMGPRAKHAIAALREAAEDKFPEVRMEALLALGSIGPDARSALPTVLSSLNDEFGAVHYAAMFALGQIADVRSADEIRKRLDSKDPMLATLSAWALARVTPNDAIARERALKILVDALGAKEPSVRAGAARALGDFSAEAGQISGALAELLADEEPTVVANAIQTLVGFGEPIVPAMIEALNDPNRRMAAIAVLEGLGPKAKDAAVALVKVVGNADDADFRQETGFALAAIGPAAAPAVDELVKLLDDPDSRVVHAACFALGKIGPAAKKASSRLRENLHCDDQFLELSCAWALLKIQPNNAEVIQLAIPQLIDALAGLQELGRIEAAVALGEIGPAAKSAAEALRKAEGDASPAVRDAATDALKKIGA